MKIIGLLFIPVLTIAILAIFYRTRGLKIKYKREVNAALGTYLEKGAEPLTDADIQNLPITIQKYIRQSGAMGQPKVWNFRVEMMGHMRKDANSKVMTVRSYQYNFISSPTRMYYIEGSLFGIPIVGLHAYKNEEGLMKIRLLGLFDVVDVSGEEMNISDTVTIFNDMCLFAPGSLIDKRITWEPVDMLTTRAVFKNGSHSVKALLTFNQKGELIDFVSDDRYRIDKISERLQWSTPVHGYKDFKGFKLLRKGSAVWHRENEAFTYADFDLTKIEYNVRVFN